jgi:outer membrane lipoprotein SlyB
VNNKSNNHLKTKNRLNATTTNQFSPTFQGKAGAIGGILVGGAVAVALSFTVAPVLVCAGPLLGAIAGTAGDKLEDEISKSDNNKKNE